MAVVEVVEAKVTADTSQFDRSMGRVSGSFANLGAAAKKGMAVVGTAMAAGGVAAAAKGITAFAGFESGLNEVFTLMPGITKDAMGAMGDDVKKFSKEMGVATGEAIPALYQAISAGVPQDNVFEFLETAQMAAVGGVTDLETAVDGISSVVNAYGSDVVSAAEASDLMFTAVKLGKTDFEQLSRSIFQVAPIAASMGVEFADVSAALASLTAQGVPTSVAATQIKGAVSELGKEGTKASEAFKKFSGQTFNEFIAGGGDLVQAFMEMKGGADAAGQSVLDSFGSIEAGQAVLALTADGGEAFAAALEEMGVSAGATETAFETMEESLSRDFDKIKANVEVLLIEIGSKLAPLVAAALGFIVDNFDTFKATVKNVADTARTVFGNVRDAVMAALPPIRAVVIGLAEDLTKKLSPAFNAVSKFAQNLGDKLLKKLQPAIKAVTKFAEGLVDAFREDGVAGAVDYLRRRLQPLIDKLKPVRDTVVDLGKELADRLQPAIEAITRFAEDLADAFAEGGLGGAADYVIERLRPIGEWMERNQPIMAAFATLVATVVVVKLYAMAVAFGTAAMSAFTAAAGFIAANAAMLVIPLALAALVGGLVYAYQNFETFRNIVDAVVDGAQAAFRWFMADGIPILKQFGRVVFEISKDVLKFFKAMYDALKPVLVAVAETVFNVVRDVIERFQSLYDFLMPIFEFIVQLYINYYTTLLTGAEIIFGVIQRIIGFFGDLFTGIAGFVGDIIETVQSMIDFILDIPNKMVNLAGDVKDTFVGVGKAILDGIAEGVGAATDFIADFATGVGNGIIRFINTQIINRINSAIPDSIPTPFPFPDISLPPNPIPSIPELADGGIVTRPTLAMVGEGGESEAVIPLSRLDRMMGGGGQTINVTVNMPVGSDGAEVVRSLQRYARAHGGTVPILTGQL